MRKPRILVVAVIGLALSGGINSVLAGTMSNDSVMKHQNISMANAGMQMKHEGQGVIKAIDVKDSKVQISHEAIASLQWPPMTMWFALNTPLPGRIKVGDKIRFELTQADGRAWKISKIEPR